MPTVTEPPLWERHAGAACRPPHGYRRHEPEKTLLHAVVREQLETFLAEARERTGHGLPAFVERELRGYLDCGLLSRGFTRSRCPDCGFERLVAFSCKASICPSCAARRMEDGADHLTESLPHPPASNRPVRPASSWLDRTGRSSSPGSTENGFRESPHVLRSGPFHGLFRLSAIRDTEIHREYIYAESKDGEWPGLYFDRRRQRWFLQGAVE